MNKLYVLLISGLMALGTATTALAQVTFTCTAGKNFGQNEGIDKMFDGNLETKYCQNAGDDCYALVTASEPIYVWGYELTTANDNKQYGRCVKRWSVYGTNDVAVASDANAQGWVTLSGFGTNNFVQQADFYTQRFFCDKSTVGTAYKYFKVVLNEGGFIQASEFSFCYDNKPVVTYSWESSSDDNSKKAVDWLVGQKWEGNNLAGNWLVIKTDDDKAHTVKSYSFTTHDDGSYGDRAPKSWKIEGSNDKSSWEVIDEVTDGKIENANYKTFDFTPANVEGAYKYIKLTLNSMKGTGWTQISEFHVVGACETHDWELTSGKEATCVEDGGAEYTCKVCGVKKLTGVIQATGIHTYQDGYCSVCHRPDPSVMTAVEGYYQPTTVAEFQWLAAMVQYNDNVNIRLTQDVDLTGFAGFGNGDDVVPFKGELDGQGHWLKNLRIDVSKKNSGLFGMTEGATIKNVGFDNCYVKTDKPNAGVVVGNAKNTTITGVAVVKGSYSESWDHTGAIVGNTEGTTTIKNCLADITVLSGGYQAGGLVGTSNGLTLENCLFTGEVRNNNYNAAGLVSLIDSEAAPTALRNNISAAWKIWVGKDDGLYSLINTGGRQATYVNNHVASEIVYCKGNPEENVTKTLTNANDENGVQTPTHDMQCKSFYTETMHWDMTNDWKLVKAGAYPVLAWMDAEETTTVTVTAAGYATYVPADHVVFSIENEAEVKAYTVKVMDGYVALTRVAEVPAGEAVVVEAAEGEHNVAYAVEYNNTLTDNDLQVATEAITADGTQYVLAKPAADSYVGFYQVENGSEIAAGKGYLVATSGAKFIGFDAQTTAVERVETINSDAVVYNLAGQRVATPVKGINVIGGKKMVVK